MICVYNASKMHLAQSKRVLKFDANQSTIDMMTRANAKKL